MKFEFQKDRKGIKLLPIAISKVIGTMFGVAIILNFTAGLLLIFRPMIPILIIGLIFLPFYIYLKNDPQGWSNNVTIDFIKKEIRKNGQRLDFNSIKQVKALQFEGFIFPTYYKISLIDLNGGWIKLVAIRSPKEYLDILNAFNSCNIKVN